MADTAEKFVRVDQIRVDLVKTIGRQETADIRLKQLEDRIADARSGRLLVQEERLLFRQFMDDCRNIKVTKPSKNNESDGIATDPDKVTLACSSAWQQRMEAEQQNPWQDLAAQIPPGILLLFLLATLGGLYRYNLRLAGFHHSRADALELLIVYRVKFDAHTLATVSDALAADKVEFGRSKTPADQAVEMFKAVMDRTK